MEVREMRIYDTGDVYILYLNNLICGITTTADWIAPSLCDPRNDGESSLSDLVRRYLLLKRELKAGDGD